MKMEPSKIIKHLNDKWQGCACPYCGGSEWNVGGKIFELREFNKGDLFIGGPNSSILPVTPVICSKCGNTVFINTIIAGLAEDE